MTTFLELSIFKKKKTKQKLIDRKEEFGKLIALSTVGNKKSSTGRNIKP